ncbi:MAG: class I SAM-dependent methyltransferase [Candidatus Tantalella remota]|nr:class I SAM-dependent methyltransferase [Candidatus Tantalella remota]
MEFTTKATEKEIEDNHKLFEERQTFYKKKGLDFQKSREFLLEKTGRLEGSILEIGSGKGKTAITLVRAGYDIVSVDMNEEMLRGTALNLAYEKLLSKVKLYMMDAYSLEFKENSFNNVFIIEALHHIEDISGVFLETDRVLVKGGTLILSDFNENGMEIIDQAHRQEGNVHENSFVGKEAASSWLSSCGYKIRSYEDKCHWILIAGKEE